MVSLPFKHLRLIPRNGAVDVPFLYRELYSISLLPPNFKCVRVLLYIKRHQKGAVFLIAAFNILLFYLQTDYFSSPAA